MPFRSPGHGPRTESPTDDAPHGPADRETTGPSAPPTALVMTARDERIHALRAQGLTTRQIAAEVGLTHARVVQILGRERRTLAEVEAGLRGELADLIAERERITTRIAAVRRALARIESEREVAQIDRMLGLA